MLSPELALVLKDRPSAESSALRGSREWCGNNGRRCVRSADSAGRPLLLPNPAGLGHR